MASTDEDEILELQKRLFQKTLQVKKLRQSVQREKSKRLKRESLAKTSQPTLETSKAEPPPSAVTEKRTLTATASSKDTKNQEDPVKQAKEELEKDNLTEQQKDHAKLKKTESTEKPSPAATDPNQQQQQQEEEEKTKREKNKIEEAKLRQEMAKEQAELEILASALGRKDNGPHVRESVQNLDAGPVESNQERLQNGCIEKPEPSTASSTKDDDETVKASNPHEADQKETVRVADAEVEASSEPKQLVNESDSKQGLMKQTEPEVNINIFKVIEGTHERSFVEKDYSALWKITIGGGIVAGVAGVAYLYFAHGPRRLKHG